MNKCVACQWTALGNHNSKPLSLTSEPSINICSKADTLPFLVRVENQPPTEQDVPYQDKMLGLGLGERHKLERDKSHGGLIIDKDSLVQLTYKQGLLQWTAFLRGCGLAPYWQKGKKAAFLKSMHFSLDHLSLSQWTSSWWNISTIGGLLAKGSYVVG